ncbi:unnamed protein product, partial [Rotaria magnacalcarata]
RQQLDNQNNKRWSTSIIDNNDQEEQISCQSSCLTLLTNKLRSNSNITSGISRKHFSRVLIEFIHNQLIEQTRYLNDKE